VQLYVGWQNEVLTLNLLAAVIIFYVLMMNVDWLADRQTD